MLSKKTHDYMRKLQLIFAALAGALGILSAAVDLGKVGIVTAAIISSMGYFFGQLAEDDSGKWEKTVDIVPKEEING